MKDLLNKISSYNLFNYLLPGVIFVALASRVTQYSLIQQDIVIGLFLYYFIGLVISRFGSLIIEPLLKGLSFLRCAEYQEFVVASQKDEKLDVLSEVNNTYRTLLSLFGLLLLLKLYEKIEVRVPVLKNYNAIALIVLLLVVFLFSYRKQTGYIANRVKANK